jgi:hypothetical protein
LKVWRLSYNGDRLGWYHNDNGDYSKGPATETDLYDPVHGIEVAYSFKSNTNGVAAGGDGTWTEDYSDDYQLEDTNLSFTAPVTTSVQTTTAATTTDTSSYDVTWYIYLKTDPQKKQWADLNVKYSFPDKVKPGERFDVQVSLTYLKNENATIPWVEFFDVNVHVRKPETKENVTSAEPYTSGSRLKPGESYSGVLSLQAPSEPGEYVIALTWMTFTPETEAYGRTMDAGELSWDTGEVPADLSEVRLIVETTVITTATSTTGPAESTVTPATSSSTLAVETTTPTAVEKPPSESYWYYIGAGLIAIVIVLFVALTARRRGRAVASQPSQTPSPAITGPSTTAADEKFCVNCGSQIPATTAFCPKCGERQP